LVRTPGGTAADRGLGRPGFWLAGLAFSALVFAHRLAYFLAIPDDHHRAEVLEATGHRYLPLVAILSAAGLVAGLTGLVTHRLVRARTPEAPEITLGSLAGRLAVLQCVGFLGLETAERLVSGAGPAHLLVEPAVALGLVVQIIVAVAGALLVTVFRSALDRLIRWSGRRTHPRTASLERPRRPLPPRFRVATGGATVRGPPSSPV
jgi:hypothetical protein